MEGLELTAFQIISSVGTARSSYIEAIQQAKEGNFAEAESLIKEGDEVFVEGHNAHAGLLQQDIVAVDSPCRGPADERRGV